MLPLYITSGEPAGIGPDICLDLADRIDDRPVVVLADINMLRDRAKIFSLLSIKGRRSVWLKVSSMWNMFL